MANWKSFTSFPTLLHEMWITLSSVIQNVTGMLKIKAMLTPKVDVSTTIPQMYAEQVFRPIS